MQPNREPAPAVGPEFGNPTLRACVISVMKRWTILMGSVVLAAACGGAAGTPPSKGSGVPNTISSSDGYAALTAARDTWESVGLESYHYEFENDCGECGPMLAASRRVVVWDGEEYDPGAGSPTVEEMFDEIERALDEGKSVDVVFDDEFGHPVEVEIDMESRPVDGGTHWIIHRLEPGLPGDDVSISDVVEAEQRWLTSRPNAYEYVLSVWCDCPLEGSVVTRVEGERIVWYEVLYDEYSGGSITPLAIDDMFSDLADLMSAVDGVVEEGIRFTGSARFHPDLGYPIWIGLDIEVLREDPIPDALPERLVVTMSDLRPLEIVADSLDGERDALRMARKRWQTAGIDDYTYQLTVHAMATADFTGPFLVVVEDGQVVKATRDGSPVDPGPVTVYTVNEMFDLIDRHLVEGVASAVLYDESLGFPVLVQLDLDSIAVDGGLVFSVDSFQSEG